MVISPDPTELNRTTDFTDMNSQSGNEVPAGGEPSLRRSIARMLLFVVMLVLGAFVAHSQSGGARISSV